MFYITKNYQLLFMTIVSISFSSSYTADKECELILYDAYKNVFIGAMAGGLEPLCTQPFINSKNLGQQHCKSFKEIIPMVRANPQRLYKGLAINVVCSVPATAVQIGFEGIVKRIIPSDDLSSVIARNTILGCCSALTCVGTEFVMARQLAVPHSAIQIMKDLYQKHGAAIFARGLCAKAARDSIYCMGFLTYYPYAKAFFEENLNTYNDTEPLSKLNGPLATITASCVVMGPAALISHPFDTLSTRLQTELGKGHSVTYRDIIKEGHSKGLRVFFYRGCGARAGLLTVAVPIITGIKDGLEPVFMK